jgi:hypothetical protein
MKQGLVRYALAAGFVVTAAGLSLGGCAENDSVMYIDGVYNLEESGCRITNESSFSVLTQGVMDLAVTGSYALTLHIGNQITRRSSRDQLRTETSRVVIRGVEVELVAVDDSPLAAPFTAIGQGFANPGTGVDPGFGFMNIVAIPPGAITEPQMVIVKMRAFGDTLGGEEVESSRFDFPVLACDRCLIDYPSNAVDPTDNSCFRPADAEDTGICRPGQDAIVPCYVCSSFADSCKVCPDEVCQPPEP